MHHVQELDFRSGFGYIQHILNDVETFIIVMKQAFIIGIGVFGFLGWLLLEIALQP